MLAEAVLKLFSLVSEDIDWFFRQRDAISLEILEDEVGDIDIDDNSSIGCKDDRVFV